MTLNEFKNYMNGYKDALENAPTDADCRKMLERIFELIETVREMPGLIYDTPNQLFPSIRNSQITWQRNDR